MKTNILLILLFALAGNIASCTKCVHCKNECYQCGGSTNMTIICSSDYANPQAWEAEKRFLVGNGCALTNPSDDIKLCDDHIDNIIPLYENNNYTCDK